MKANSHLNGSNPKRSILKFFLLVFSLTVPFWVIGALTTLQLLPGVPFAALAVVCPVLAAAILVFQENKIAGVRELLMRSFDYRRITAKIWLSPIVFLLPAVSFLSFLVIRATGVPIPVPRFGALEVLGLLVVFFIAALGEELGWSGYALDSMQKRSHALSAGLVIGLLWAAWHIVPLLQTHRSLDWVAWWCVGTVALRIVMVWLYNHAGRSVFAMALFHAISNVCWQLFPIHGSYFDPRINGLIMFGIAVAVVGGTRTLTNRRLS